eukprot:EG_transcript_24254
MFRFLPSLHDEPSFRDEFETSSQPQSPCSQQALDTRGPEILQSFARMVGDLTSWTRTSSKPECMEMDDVDPESPRRPPLAVKESAALGWAIVAYQRVSINEALNEVRLVSPRHAPRGAEELQHLASPCSHRRPKRRSQCSVP